MKKKTCLKLLKEIKAYCRFYQPKRKDFQEALSYSITNIGLMSFMLETWSKDREEWGDE